MGTLFTYYDGTLEEFLSSIKEINDNRLVKIVLLPATTLEEIGIVRTSYSHVLDNFAVQHIITHHANEHESLRGQINIQESDFLLIPDILSRFETCLIERKPSGRIVITYAKNYSDCIRCYVEEIRKGRRELAGVTYYKRKRKLTDAKSP